MSLRNKNEEKMPINNENSKRVGPLKLRPSKKDPVFTQKKDPAFTQKRNKIIDNNDRIYPKDKISLSNRSMIPHSFEQRPSQIRNHIGLQISR